MSELSEDVLAEIDARARELTIEHEARKLAAIPEPGVVDRIGVLFVAGLALALSATVIGVVGLVGFWIVCGFGRIVGAW